MPIYEYLCRDCGTRNEFLEGVTREQEAKVCVDCGGEDLHKLISMSNFSIVSGSQAACECGEGPCDDAGGCCGGACGL
jgi:putative FmdB family regulatory protein